MEPVSNMHLGGARAVLDGYGYLDKDEFFPRLRWGIAPDARSAAPSAGEGR